MILSSHPLFILVDVNQCIQQSVHHKQAVYNILLSLGYWSKELRIIDDEAYELSNPMLHISCYISAVNNQICLP